MDERRIMKYQMVKLTLQGVVSVAVSGLVEGLSALLIPKSNKKAREKIVKVGEYVVSEIISGAIGSVIDKDVDDIKEYYDAISEQTKEEEA